MANGNNTNRAMTPEEIEKRRAFGEALMGRAFATPAAIEHGGAMSPLSLLVRPMQAFTGRQAITVADKARARQRQNLYSPTDAAPTPTSAPQTTGSIDRAPQRTASTTPSTPNARTSDTRTPRGYRNNNPGNIEFGNFARRHGATGSDGRFAIFPSIAAGRNAQRRLLSGYIQTGTNTIKGIVSRWAPTSEEANRASHGNYVNYVARRVGLQPNQRVTASHVPLIATAMEEFENGRTRGDRAAETRTVNTIPINERGTADTGRMNLGGPESAERASRTEPVGGPTAAAAPTPTRVAQTTETPAGGTSTAGAQPPRQLNNLLAQSLPANTDRIQRLEHMLSNAAMLSHEDAMKLQEEYYNLIGPQTREIRNAGTATYTYNPQARRYQLDRFQPNPNIQSLSVGGITVPNIYSFDRESGWQTISPQGIGDFHTETRRAPSDTGASPAPDTRELREAIASGNPARIKSAIDQYTVQLEQQRISTTGGTEATKQLADNALQTGIAAPALITGLDTLRSALQLGKGFHGPLGDQVLDVQRALKNLGFSDESLTWLTRNTPMNELASKLQTMLATRSTRTLTSNPSAFSYGQIIGATPGLSNTLEGALMLVDYMKAEQKHYIDVARIVNNNRDKSPSEVLDLVEEYYADKPIVLNVPARTARDGTKYPAMGITTNRINSQEDFDSIESGVYFIGSDGKLRQKP